MKNNKILRTAINVFEVFYRLLKNENTIYEALYRLLRYKRQGENINDKRRYC